MGSSGTGDSALTGAGRYSQDSQRDQVNCGIFMLSPPFKAD